MPPKEILVKVVVKNLIIKKDVEVGRWNSAEDMIIK